MAIDYSADWDRRLQNEFGGDRDRLYDNLLEELSSSYSFDPENPFQGSGTDREQYLRGISAADIGEYFVQPRLAESRSNFESALRKGHKRALGGAGRRMAAQQNRLGVPLSGAVTRTEGSIGRPEGLAASSWLAQRKNEHEDALLNDPNVYAPIANISSSIMNENEKHASRARIGQMALTAAAAGTSWAPPVAAGFAAGAGGVQLGIDDQTRLATSLAAKFNPGLWSARRNTSTAPGSGGAGLNYQPFGSNEGALGGLYGGSNGRSREEEEENYLFGGFA